jgi:hypothetical protein
MDGTRNSILVDDFYARLGAAPAPIVLGGRRSAHFSGHDRVIDTRGGENVR